MEDQSLAPHPAPISRKYFTFPLEIQEHISSFLDQRDLLRAGGVSKVWRQAVKITWKIKSLDLSKRNNELGDDGAKSISIRDFPPLTTLDLSDNSIGNDGAKSISVGNFPGLKSLDLSDNCIAIVNDEAEGIATIATRNFPLLTTLNLKDNEFKD